MRRREMRGIRGLHPKTARRRRERIFVGYGVDVGKILARRFHMLIEVVVGAIRNAPKLAPAEREFIFEVGRCLGVEAKFFFFVVAEFEIFVSHAEVEQPLMAEVLPICKPFEIGAGFAENSSSICSNSRMRKIKLPGVISLRKLLPI